MMQIVFGSTQAKGVKVVAFACDVVGKQNKLIAKTLPQKLSHTTFRINLYA